MFLVDTNVLVYAADTESAFHGTCLESLQEWRTRSAAWFLTWPILYEFMRVTTHPRVLRKPWTLASAWRFVDALLASPGLAVLAATDRHAAVAATTIGEMPHLTGTVIHDLHTAILMREHGVRQIFTRDVDFHRFKFLDVIDPVEGGAVRP